MDSKTLGFERYLAGQSLQRGTVYGCTGTGGRHGFRRLGDSSLLREYESVRSRVGTARSAGRMLPVDIEYSYQCEGHFRSLYLERSVSILDSQDNCNLLARRRVLSIPGAIAVCCCIVAFSLRD